MIRQIKYTILDENQTRKIEPANPQWAGIQYENDATEVVFDITTLINKMQYPVCRIDFNSPSAGNDPGNNIIAENINGKHIISRTIPSSFTQYGGSVQITAVITEGNNAARDITDDSMVVYSYPVEVNFTAVRKDALSNSRVITNLSAMEEKVKSEIEKTAEENKTDLENAVASAKVDIEKSVDSAEIAESNALVSENNAKTYSEKALQHKESAKNSAEEAEDFYNQMKASASEIYSGTSISEANTDGVPIVYTPREAGDELLNAKVGDFYINTEKKFIFQCVDKASNSDRSYWMRLNPFVDRNYNYRSANAQSGFAVAKAIEGKADKSELDGLATQTFVRQTATELRTEAKQSQDVFNMALNFKEDNINKANSLFVDKEEYLEGKYPSALASKQYTDNMVQYIQGDTNEKLERKVDKEEVNNNFANAVKGNAIGTDVVTVKDVSPLEHKIKIKADKDTGIAVCGKNLLSVNEATFTQYKTFNINPIPAGDYVLSAIAVDTTGSDGDIYITFSDSTNAKVGESRYFKKNRLNSTKISLSGTAVKIALYAAGNYNSSAGITATYSEVMIEKNDIVSDYEPYNLKGTYNLNANEEQEIPSFSSYMNFVSVEPQTIIKCQYNRDNSLLSQSMDVIYSRQLTEEDVTASALVVKKDNDEKKFLLDEAYLYICLPTATTETLSSISAIFNNGSGSGYYWFISAPKTGSKFAQAYAKRMGKKQWFMLFNQFTSDLHGSGVCSGYNGVNIDYISSLEITNIKVLPVGTRIVFCGRRVG